jgi:hypothetical protein
MPGQKLQVKQPHIFTEKACGRAKNQAFPAFFLKKIMD